MAIAQDVADGDRSVILEQVTNGLAVRMAVMYLLSGGEAAKDEETQDSADARAPKDEQATDSPEAGTPEGKEAA